MERLLFLLLLVRITINRKAVLSIQAVVILMARELEGLLAAS
jgi:hypothetical protein